MDLQNNPNFISSFANFPNSFDDYVPKDSKVRMRTLW